MSKSSGAIISRPIATDISDISYAREFPREAERLYLRVKQRTSEDGPWSSVAKFVIRNPTDSANLPWAPQPRSITVAADGMEFTLGDVTMEIRSEFDGGAWTQHALPGHSIGRDIWNHRVLLPFRVQTNGVTLTNWTPAYRNAEDATGNWNWEYFGGDPSFTNGWVVEYGRCGLDPRAPWKLDVDFAPQAEPPRESLYTLHVPVHLAKPMTINLGGVSLKVGWANQKHAWVEMPTRLPSLRVLFVKARDAGDRDLDRESGPGTNTALQVTDLSQAGGSIEATIAIVPNVHVRYLVQPRLLPPSGPNRARDAVWQLESGRGPASVRWLEVRAKSMAK